MWMTLLLRNWRLIALAAVIAGALLAVWSYGQRCDQAGYQRARAEMASAVRKAEEATKLAEAKAHAITEAKDREWQTERNQLQDRVADLLARPAPAIRVCKPASRREVSGVPGTAAQPDAATADSGSAVQAGADIRGPLILYGGDCERTRSQLSALQGWVRAQAEQPL